MTPVELSKHRSPVTSDAGSFDSADKMIVFLLVAISACFSWLQWGKMDSLWGDSARWMGETYRVFQGDMPFRDVSALYPPLYMYVFAFSYKLFGHTFGCAQAIVDILSTALVVSTYFLARHFLSRRFSALVTACLAVSGLSSGYSFALYSLNIYAPSALLAGGFLNLFLIALLRMIESRNLRVLDVALAATGGSLAILSRAEYAVPVLACLGLMNVFLWDIGCVTGPPFQRALKLAIVSILIVSLAALGFTWLIVQAGPRAVVAGVLNYGNATMVCPWWPTGLGLLGFCAGLAEAGLVYVAGAFLLRRTNGRKVKLLAAGGAGLVVTVAYLTAAWDLFPQHWALPGPRQHYSVRENVQGLMALTHLLIPVMSATVMLVALFCLRVIRSSFRRERITVLITPASLLYVAVATLCIRSLFGTVLTELPGLSSFVYPVLFVITAILLQSAFRLSDGLGPVRATIARALPALFFCAYGGLRLAWFVSSSVPRLPLNTLAGKIYVTDPSAVAVYDYVAQHTTARDAVADISYYGGGVNFAARRRAPLFMTAFTFCLPDEQYLWNDARRITTAKPEIVIGNRDAHLGTRYGGGTRNGCVFPGLVWRSPRITGDPERILPIVDAVKENYTRTFESGTIQVLERKESSRSAGQHAGAGQ